MRTQIKAFVQKHRNKAMLFYASDGTPEDVVSRFTVRLGPLTAQRRGKSCKEYLVERFYLQVDTVQGPEAVVLFRDPLELTKGQGALPTLAAEMQLTSLLRQLGHEGISVTVRAWDRKLFKPLRRRSIQRHFMFNQARKHPRKL